MTANPPTKTPRLSFAGAPLTVSPWWILVVVFVGMSAYTLTSRRLDLPLAGVAAALYPVTLFFSVLLHELAHAYAGRALGQKPTVIAVHLLGGHTAFDRTATTPRAQFLVAAVGPLTNVALAAIFQITAANVSPDNFLFEVLHAGAWMNWAVAIFNAIPGLPLDGGQMLAAAVWKITGNERNGIFTAAGVGVVLGAVVIAYGVYELVGANMVSGGWALIIGSSIARSAHLVWRSEVWRRRVDSLPLANVVEPARAVDVSTPVALVGPVTTHVLITSEGYIIGLVDAAAMSAVPAHARSHTPVSSVMVTLPAHKPLPPQVMLGRVITRIYEIGGSHWAVGPRASEVQAVLTAERVNAVIAGKRGALRTSRSN